VRRARIALERARLHPSPRGQVPRVGASRDTAGSLGWSFIPPSLRSSGAFYITSIQSVAPGPVKYREVPMTAKFVGMLVPPVARLVSTTVPPDAPFV
jgi:hypothetical protein